MVWLTTNTKKAGVNKFYRPKHQTIVKFNQFTFFQFKICSKRDYIEFDVDPLKNEKLPIAEKKETYSK